MNEKNKPLALFLQPAGVAIGAGEIGVLRVDVDEIVTLRIHLVEGFSVALRENEMARFAVARLDRLFAVGRVVLSVMATEAAVPVFVTDKIRVGAPVEFLFREKVSVIDGPRLIDDLVGLGRVGISFV